jgi:hypothetical protein
VRIGIAFCMLFSGAIARAEDPKQVSVCQLKDKPAAFNHQLVELSAFITHGFEDFELFDPACPDYPPIWLEYGGSISSGTIYCCGVGPDRTRPEPVKIENIPIPLLTDNQFSNFDRLIQQPPDRIVRATLIGRFFSGERRALPNGRVDWGGYGHFGCCSLLAIQQIRSVEPQTRADLDYRASPDQPDITQSGCGSYRFLTPIDPSREVLAAQRKAERENIAWPFVDPQRVAAAYLAELLGIRQATVIGLVRSQKSAGRVLYRWKPKGKGKSYLVVTSRPYWLSFYAKDANKVAWVTIAAYETCR